MYESPDDTVPQLTRFLSMLERHRLSLEQQLRDIRETLSEITAHETRARQLLAQAGRTPQTPAPEA